MDNHVVISLGVGDIEHAKQFYCDGLGFELERAKEPFAAFKQSNSAPGLALYSGDPLNYDARLVEDRGGYRGVSLAYVVDTPERVDELMARAERAGATILEPARERRQYASRIRRHAPTGTALGRDPTPDRRQSRV